MALKRAHEEIGRLTEQNAIWRRKHHELKREHEELKQECERLAELVCELPMARVWDPPGPFGVDIKEHGIWHEMASVPSLVEAARLASRLVRRDWRVHGRAERVQITSPDGIL